MFDQSGDKIANNTVTVSQNEQLHPFLSEYLENMSLDILFLNMQALK